MTSAIGTAVKLPLNLDSVSDDLTFAMLTGGWLAELQHLLPYERSFQLLGLKWGGAGSAEVNRVAGELRRLQRAMADGRKWDAGEGQCFPTRSRLLARNAAYPWMDMSPDGKTLAFGHGVDLEPQLWVLEGILRPNHH